MKLKHSSLALSFLIAALAAGCDKSSPDSAATQDLNKVKADTAQAASDMKNYTYAQKDEFVKYMQGELDVLNQEIIDLGAKIDKASDQVKADAKPKLDALKQQAADLGVQLDNAKAATEPTWDAVKTGAQKALDTTKQAFTDAGTWIDQQLNTANSSPASTSAKTPTPAP